MNPSIVLALFGVAFLFISGLTWAGVGLTAVAVIVQIVSQQKTNTFVYGGYPFVYPESNRQSDISGFEWSIREDYFGLSNRRYVPKVEGGMFNLPLPMGELSDIVEFKHKTRIG